MTRYALRTIAFLTLMLAFASTCFALDAKTVAVAAAVPAQNILSVSVSQIVGTTWTPATSMDFGTLTFDNVNNIFTAPAYYAVDVGVNSNASSWTVTHTRSSVVNGTNNLDNNINVTFLQQNATTGTQLDKLSFLNSNNKAYTNVQIGSGNWLRIYYGIGTGDPLNDAPGVVPIGATKPNGSYSGSVTLTLTP